MTEIKLTSYSRSAGCGCKIAPAVLNTILKDKGTNTLFPGLLVGNDKNDDAAIMDIGNGKALISTTDFFMPIVDDPYDFGRVAAANAISDVYAMGGKPVLAIAVLGWPVDKLSPELAALVIKGGETICNEAGLPLAGGHSIDSPEPFFGLAVNGIIDIANIKRNHTAKEGDHLFITKPIGTGILATALKRGLILQEEKNKLLEQMVELNKIGEELGKLQGVNAMTDITGFGLIGHLHEMATGSGLTAIVNNNDIELMEGVDKYREQFCFPDNTTRNLNNYKNSIKGMDDLEFITLCDPQTNGGILISVAPDSLKAYLEVAKKSKFASVATKSIGRMEAKKDRAIIINKAIKSFHAKTKSLVLQWIYKTPNPKNHRPMQTKLLLTVTLSLIVLNAFSQRTCHSAQYWEQQKAKYPQAEFIKKDLETNAKKWIASQPIDRFTKANQQGERAAVITIPVVVHIVHDGDALNTGSNISLTQINSQITALNKDYRLLNSDSLLSTHAFWANTADCTIEFCLAKQDEQGNATTGITRTQAAETSYSYNEADKIKQTATGGIDGWDPFKYLNIWVYVSDPTEGILGFATGPATLSFSPEFDGVAIDYHYFGTVGSASFPFDLGRTTTHEVGHWLNLDHIWGDSFCGNDGIGDTPEAEDANFNCPGFPHNANNSCGAGANGEMYMNYMDYVDDDCMVMFTNGQSAAMHAALNGPRQDILTSAGCNPPSQVSINDLFEEMISISPNPSRGILNIGFSDETGSALLKISIADITGKVHIIKEVKTENGSCKLDASQLPNGVYFVKIEEGQHVSTKKITLIGK